MKAILPISTIQTKVILLVIVPNLQKLKSSFSDDKFYIYD